MIDAKEFEAMEGLFHRVRELAPEEAASAIAEAELSTEARAMLDDMLESDRKESQAEDGDTAGTSAAHRLLGEAFGGADGVDWQAAVDAAAAMGDPSKAGEEDLPHLLDNRYLLTEILSRSLVGVTFRAVDQRTREKVAVRRIQLIRADGLAPRIRRSELKRLAQIEHPGLERVLDTSGLTGPKPYVVTELHPGRPIDEWLESRSPTRDDLLRLFIGACGALHVAHQARIVHRHLRPSAILVDQPRDSSSPATTRLIGFGAELGRAGRAADPEAFVCAAPELANVGERPTIQSDVYAMGAVLRWLATGDTSSITASAQHGRRRWSRGARVSGGGLTSAPLAAAIDRAISADPINRHPSAAALAEDVRACVEGRPSPTYLRNTLASKPLARAAYLTRLRLRRTPTRVFGAAAAALLVLIVALAVPRLASGGARPDVESIRAAMLHAEWSHARALLDDAADATLMPGGERAALRGARAELLLLESGLLERAPGPRAQWLAPPAHAGVMLTDADRRRLAGEEARELIERLQFDGLLDLSAELPASSLLSLAASLTDLDAHDAARVLLARAREADASAQDIERIDAVLGARRALLAEDRAAFVASARQLRERADNGSAADRLIAAQIDLLEGERARAEVTLADVAADTSALPEVRRFASRLNEG